MKDPFCIGGKELSSRLFIGTGKFSSNEAMRKAIIASGSEVVTVALRRVDASEPEENILSYVPKHCVIMANTSGARDAKEAIRIARLARAGGCGNWIKIEVISDTKYLLPDNFETLKAVEVLAAEGFVVLPYMSPDLMMGRRMRDAGAAAIMPLGSPIGTNRGLRTEELVRIMIEEIGAPVIVDAGLGAPSDAARCMELGAAAVLVNTAIAVARDPEMMARAFKEAVTAGRGGYIAGLGPKSEAAMASSPLTGFLREEK